MRFPQQFYTFHLQIMAMICGFPRAVPALFAALPSAIDEVEGVRLPSPGKGLPEGVA
jgi:hypothetical protein